MDACTYNDKIKALTSLYTNIVTSQAGDNKDEEEDNRAVRIPDGWKIV